MPSQVTKPAFTCRLNYRLQIMPLLVALTLIGCGKPTETPVSQTANHVSENAAAITSERSSTQSETKVSRFVSAETLPEHWVTPLNKDDLFFMPPNTTEVQSNTAEAPQGRANVKFLGVVTLTGEESETKAILKIEGELAYLSAGEKYGGIELLSIDDRTVRLQQGRERWSLALVQQASTNAQVPYRPSGQRQSSAANPFSRTNNNTYRQQQNARSIDRLPSAELPDLDLPEIKLPEIELPEIEIPEIELPDIDMPDLDLPANDFP
ncbi:MAG TPA: hypothetical protein DDW52_28125 [Planctomycetaceae bacterium]|nr:hypothetical protein [Planctomycetaceae bacterium]